MRKPPIPKDELDRLAELHRLDILDTPAEERFDRLTRLAQAQFQVPIVVISLVDADRQWFKSRQGLDVCETSRDVSFCGHTILRDEILHVPNALDDARFVSNPLVSGPPHIRFYAGAPLVTRGGHRVGTLCLIGDRPRELSDAERRQLRDLADCVQEELNRCELQDLLHALVAAKQEAEESNRLKSEFLNMVSHELRTPLTVVLGYLPLLQDPAKLPPAELVAEIASDMLTAGDHLLHLINDLLDLSKIEAGKLKLRPEALALDEVVEEVLGQQRIKAEPKGLALVSQVGKITLIADPVRLRQILINLVGNAIKFTEEGTVTVAARCLDGQVELRVKDTGIGIPKEDLPSIFDRFKQVDSSSTRKAGGTGLGLAITKSLVELHGGTIEVESQAGEGSELTLTFASPTSAAVPQREAHQVAVA